MYIPGQNLGRLVYSVVRQKPVERRTFLIGGCEAIAAGAAMTLGLLGSRKPSFEEMVAVLGKKYTLGPCKKAGDVVLFYLEDIHVQPVLEQNMEKISTIEELVDLDLVGLEGYPYADPSRASAELQRAEAVMTLDDQNVSMISGGIPITVQEYGDDSRLIKDSRFRTIGLEKAERVFAGVLAARAEDNYDMLLQGTMQGYVPVELNGKSVPVVYQLQKIQQALKDDPLFPQFDITQVAPKSVGGNVMRVLSRDNGAEHLGECLVKFRQWMTQRQIDPRTREAAQLFMDEMEKKQYSHGALIFGRGHSNQGHYPTQTSFQKEFEKRGFSYITIQP